MPLVDLATARLHLRHDSGTSEDSLITLWLGVAERLCIEYLNRSVYATSQEVTDARDGATADLVTARDAFEAALDVIDAIEDADERATRLEAAQLAWNEARQTYMQELNAMVLNDSIKAAILLVMAHLFENRQPEYSLHLELQVPTQYRHLLNPYRIQMGV